MDNSTLSLGNGKQIKFWLDSWCGLPLFQALNMFVLDLALLNKKVSDFIDNKIWEFSLNIIMASPSLLSICILVISLIENWMTREFGLI